MSEEEGRKPGNLSGPLGSSNIRQEEEDEARKKQRRNRVMRIE